MKVLAVLLLCCVALSSAAYTLVDNFSGSTFFNNFQFFTGADPTHGYVYYASAAEAQQWSYTTVSNGQVIIRSDSTTVASGSGRGSVRITSNKSYNGGLFLFDMAHMPVGCGTWPAVWLVGPNWPNSGEIDVVEGVNLNNYNSMTLHTKTGCTIPTSTQTGTKITTNCDVNAAGNTGCSTQDKRTTSYGAGYNNNGGGVHAALWTSSGIKIWFFARNAIPADISSNNPNPANWGTPAADFPFGSNCPSSFFQNQQIVLDNTFCGDWAGQQSIFNQQCSGTCNSFVQNNPSQFQQSYWAINSFKVYQPTTSSSSSSSGTPAPSSSSSSSSGQSTSGCGSGTNYCPGNGQCYPPSSYVCSTTKPYLCPTSAPNFCGGGCSPNRC